LKHGAIAFVFVAGGTGSAAAQEGEDRRAAERRTDTHVVEAEVPAQTGPGEVTEAEVQVEEPLGARDELPSRTASGEPVEPPPPSQGITLSEAEAVDLVGRELHSADGDEVGDIVGLSRALDDQSLHLLVDVGGFFG